jgi:arylsulfatase A-like enzyme
VSLAPVLEDASAAPRDSALSQYETGYSLRTDRYRYTEWGEKGVDGKELYDRQTDPEELINLARRKADENLIGKLAGQLHDRIADAKAVPEGLQQLRFENIRRVRR